MKQHMKSKEIANSARSTLLRSFIFLGVIPQLGRKRHIRSQGLTLPHDNEISLSIWRDFRPKMEE